MKVYRVLPFGYCRGVQNAILLAKKAREENKDIPVYLLGMLVHNEETINELVSLGITFLDERKKDLESLLEEIPEGSAVIFTAHGHPEKLDEIAKNKNLKVYDATCEFVKENLQEARKMIVSNSVIYIGVGGHLEADSFMKNMPQATFMDIDKENWDLSAVKGTNPYVISQTTLSDIELEKAHKHIKNTFPNAVFGKEGCLSATLRQKAIREIPEDVDLVIILGSTTSNNSKKLLEIAKDEGKNAVLIDTFESLKKLDLSEIQHVALASGASSSPATYEKCFAYLSKID